jgi:hypothetical protein
MMTIFVCNDLEFANPWSRNRFEYLTEGAGTAVRTQPMEQELL